MLGHVLPGSSVVGPSSLLGLQSLSTSRSLPALSSAKIGTEGNGSILPKGALPTRGLGSAGIQAENIHVAQLRGGWRGNSEESRTQEVCRHLEWARGMKAAYERQVELYEQELQAQEQAEQLSRSPQQRQPKRREMLGAVLSPQSQKDLELKEERSGLWSSEALNCYSPAARGRHGGQRQNQVHVSRRPRNEPKMSARSQSLEPRRQVGGPASPSSRASVVSQDQHELKFVRLPALRMQERLKEETGHLRQSGELPKRLVISHLVQVQLNPAMLYPKLDDINENEDFFPPEPVMSTKARPKYESPDYQALGEEVDRGCPTQACEQEDAQEEVQEERKKKRKKKRNKTRHHSRKSPQDMIDNSIKDALCKQLVHLEHDREAAREACEHPASSSSQPASTGFSISARKEISPLPMNDKRRASFTSSSLTDTATHGAATGVAGVDPSALVGKCEGSAAPSLTSTHVENCPAVFRRLRYDGEIHRDQLSLSLELAGFPKPNRDWVANVVKDVTDYSTLSLDEFVDFVEKYADREHLEARNLFDLYDVDGSCSIDIGEISDLVESCGITPMGHVIIEILKEVGPNDPNEISFDQFWQVLLHIRAHEGFTKSEVVKLNALYQKFDFDKSGSLSSKELGRLLRYQGFALEPEMADTILNEVDVDGNGSLDEHEFFVCMRKVRERELVTMKQVFKDCDDDHSGTINHVELVIVLRKLGYYPEQEEIDDAAEDAGVLPGEEMDFAQLWRFVEAYRSREGFSKADVKELWECMMAKSNDGELDALDVGHLFVKLGLPVSCTQVQRFVVNVDIDGSGTIDFSEFMKIARQLAAHISIQASDSFSDGLSSTGVADMLEALVPVSYQRDINTVASKFQTDGQSLDHYECVSCIKQLRSLTRREVQKNSGFGQREMEVLREQFTDYDKNGVGFLSDPQVHRLLETLFPDLATSACSRPKLLEIMCEATKHADGAIIDFAAFVILMRKVKDLSELDRIKKEQETIQTVHFSSDEVNEYRELFLGSKDREFLTLAQVKEMLSVIVPMGAKNTKKLSKLFGKVLSDRSGRKELDFAEFLLLIRAVLQSDFGGINDHAERIAGEVITEPGDGQHSKTKDQVCCTAKELLGAFQRGSAVMHDQAHAPKGRHRSLTV